MTVQKNKRQTIAELLKSISVPPTQNNLTPLPQAELSESQKSYLKKLECFQAPYLEERLQGTPYFFREKSIESAFVEFKKYVALCLLYKKPFGMMSRPIDEVWHNFILFTKEYHAFSQEFIGSYFHHDPTISTMAYDEKPAENLVLFYTKTFGAIPFIWDLLPHAQFEPRKVTYSLPL